jgi:hypothetical protein
MHGLTGHVLQPPFIRNCGPSFKKKHQLRRTLRPTEEVADFVGALARFNGYSGVAEARNDVQE